MEESERLIAERKKPSWRSYLLYYSIYVRFQKRQNYEDRKMVIGCHHLVGGKRNEEVEHRDFKGSETILYDAIWWILVITNFQNVYITQGKLYYKLWILADNNVSTYVLWS